MPEYLAPGVYVEEVSFRSKSLEGVPTSTTGFAGMTRTGPVYYPGGPQSCSPRLITSYADFERVYGGLEPLRVGDAEPLDERLGYVAHAVRAFFENGGKRVYISRVYTARPGIDPVDPADDVFGVATIGIPLDGGLTARWNARWPGAFGNVEVATQIVRTKNIGYTSGGVRQARGARDGAVVEVYAADPPSGSEPVVLANLRVVRIAADGSQEFFDSTGLAVAVGVNDIIQLIELQVVVGAGARSDVYGQLAPDGAQKRYLGRILQRDDPEDENAIVWFQDAAPADDFHAARVVAGLYATYDATRGLAPLRLAGGFDGRLVAPADLAGQAAPPDDATVKATGLAALDEIDDIAIVALPDGGTLPTVDECAAAAGVLIAHAENNRFRIAVVDGPQGSSMNEIRAFRGRFDSSYAALYHPWIEVFDPLERPAQGAPPKRILLPPSGFVTGIYARSDIERGVHKAPANEVVRGLTRFEANINKGRNDVLNPEGINALRFFPGRGSRVWGARTMSSDPEWKYVNVRRLFIFLEHTIFKGSQWAVFEPNNERLWANVRYMVEDFLLNLWLEGALLGEKAEDAFFVRCDRTTMTQNDIDNGRLVCLIGVAPTKPAEFVIFRVGQWTADARQN